MGVALKEVLLPKSQDEFHAIDKIITGHAFDIHNALGRFCDEKIYQKLLAEQSIISSLDVACEVEVKVSHLDFSKCYKLDLLVDSGVIYELKTVESLNDSHKQQLINYLLLTGINHGKLLNFRPSSVEYEYVSTHLTKDDLHNYLVVLDEFQEITRVCGYFKSVFIDLLSDWGAFLSSGLYNEALIYFFGGVEKVVVPVDIYFNNRMIGKQNMQLLDKGTAFHLSAITRAFKGYENNMRKLIEHTHIETVQWVNFNRHEITIKTIQQV